MGEKSAGDNFTTMLAAVNGLQNFSRLWFVPEMLFHSMATWWGRGASRPSPHEGLDICYYKGKSGKIVPLGPSAKIPVIRQGRVFLISDDDFLGKSVFVRHENPLKEGYHFYTVYAHINPAAHIRNGERVETGDIIGTIADASARKTTVLSHLHLSVAWISKDFSPDDFRWKQLTSSDKVLFEDPMEILQVRMGGDASGGPSGTLRGLSEGPAGGQTLKSLTNRRRFAQRGEAIFNDPT